MDVKVFRFAGDLTVNTLIGNLKEQLDELLGQKPCILALEMSKVLHLDSSGLDILVYAYKRARELGGSVRIHRPHPRVFAILNTTRLARMFEILDDPPDEVTASLS